MADETEPVSITTPFLLVGFKTYRRATGRGALELAGMAERVSVETGICVIVSPQFTDIAPIAEATRVPLLAQHIDPIEPGSNTGQVLPEAIRWAGATGTMLNHSERRLRADELAACLHRAGDVGLVTLVCAEGREECTRIAGMGPDILLVESPELIGTGRAMSTADPDVVLGTVDAVREVDPRIAVICGAGITSGDDVTAALRLGVVGVGSASAIVKAGDPLAVMMEMATALDNGYRGKRVSILA